MRTTITLESEVEMLVRQAMRERGLSFKDVVNEGLRTGLQGAQSRRTPFSTPTFDLGPARVPLDRALALAGELEDEELLRKRALGK